MAIIATNARVEVQNATATALTVTAVTLADPGVATSAGHGLSNGDIVTFSVSDGMVELNEQAVRVANVTTDTFELEGLDTTDYSTWDSGAATPISSWYTIAASTSVNLGDATPSELDGSRLIDKREVTLYGRPGSTSGTIDVHHDPHSAAIQKLKAASVSDLLAFRVTWNNGNVCVFGAKTAYSGGFSAGNNQILTGSVPLTVPSEIMEYAS
jgi:hypothetical protein